MGNADPHSTLPLAVQLDAIIPHNNNDNDDNAAAAVVSALQGIAQSTGTAQLALNVNLAHLLDVEFLNAHIRQGQPRLGAQGFSAHGLTRVRPHYLQDTSSHSASTTTAAKTPTLSASMAEVRST